MLPGQEADRARLHAEVMGELAGGQPHATPRPRGQGSGCGHRLPQPSLPHVGPHTEDAGREVDQARRARAPEGLVIRGHQPNGLEADELVRRSEPESGQLLAKSAWVEPGEKTRPNQVLEAGPRPQRGVRRQPVLGRLPQDIAHQAAQVCARRDDLPMGWLQLQVGATASEHPVEITDQVSGTVRSQHQVQVVVDETEQEHAPPARRDDRTDELSPLRFAWGQ